MKESALELPVFLSSAKLFQNIWDFKAKKYFADHPTANTIQLSAAVKGNFSSLFFLEHVAAREISQRKPSETT